MKTLEIKRIALTPEATCGVILDDGIPFALTMEKPWLNNEKSKSCIPAGTYICKRFSSQKHSDTFEVTNVPNRDYILFHSGNTSSDSLGCILIAEEFGYIDGKVAVLSSKKGMEEFLFKLKNLDEFRIVIKEV